MPRHNMPDDWEPPVPAWSVNFGGAQSLAVAYVGVQSHTNDSADSEAAFATMQAGVTKRARAAGWRELKDRIAYQKNIRVR